MTHSPRLRLTLDQHMTLRMIENEPDATARQRLMDLELLKDANTTYYSNDTDYIECLIALGANINAQDSSGNTPLILTVSGERKDAAALLIKKGADLTPQNSNGFDALILALNYKLKATALRLIGGGAPLDRTYGVYQTTALILAVKTGKTSAVKALLGRHADPRVQDIHGKTALDYAQENDDKTSVKMIKDYITLIYEAATIKPIPHLKKLKWAKPGSRT